jgi:hypothetical protein
VSIWKKSPLVPATAPVRLAIDETVSPGPASWLLAMTVLNVTLGLLVSMFNTLPRFGPWTV